MTITLKEATKLIKPVEQKWDVRDRKLGTYLIQGLSRAQRRMPTSTLIAFMSGCCLVTASKLLRGRCYN